MKKIDSRLLQGIVSAVLGIMFITLKGGVIGIVLTLVGIAAIAMGISDFVNKQTTSAIVKCVIGVLVLVLGWVLVDIALYVVAGAFIVFGVYQIISAIKLSERYKSSQKLMLFIKPVITLVAGLCLFFNKGGMIDWLFIIIGALILAQGVITVLETLEKRK